MANSVLNGRVHVEAQFTATVQEITLTFSIRHDQTSNVSVWMSHL